ncbi:MAG: NADH-quinone oxidoreductase subunit NuoK [Clostridia bacterium]|nr:NADH-quinone oxidoreductase subunit NuoK [Clostridia bacterium]
MPIGYYLLLGSIIFAVGVYGVLTRRNVLFVFMSLEVMFGGAGLTLLAFARDLGSASGQVFVLFILAVAAAETALGLAIFLAAFRSHRTIETDKLTELKG